MRAVDPIDETSNVAPGIHLGTSAQDISDNNDQT